MERYWLEYFLFEHKYKFTVIGCVVAFGFLAWVYIFVPKEDDIAQAINHLIEQQNQPKKPLMLEKSNTYNDKYIDNLNAKTLQDVKLLKRCYRVLGRSQSLYGIKWGQSGFVCHVGLDVVANDTHTIQHYDKKIVIVKQHGQWQVVYLVKSLF